MTKSSDLAQPTAARRLIDSYGRHLHYLRLSITDRCNLRCMYCMPPEGVKKLHHQEILTLEEIARLADAAVSLGVDKIRLTGGEPLLRSNLGALLARLDGLKPRPDLRITTNGILLEDNLELLAEHGISTLNISLDTLKPERFAAITGISEGHGPKAFERVWGGVEAALASQKFQVKLNMVVLGGVNDDEVADFAQLTRSYPLAIRFIEYMPVGRHTPFAPTRFVSSEQILKDLGSLGETKSLPARPGDGPAKRFKFLDAPGELGVISAISSHFCQVCNRLRLTADGRLVPCLFSDDTIDIKPLLRSGAGIDELAEALMEAARVKPAHHDVGLATLHTSGCAMSRLGG